MEYIGSKFNRLTIVSAGSTYTSPSGKKLLRLICKCDCGTIAEIYKRNVIKGITKSCGCLSKETLRENYKKRGEYTHGYSEKYPSEYSIWRGIIARCTNVKYKNYAGRGINVCDRWRKSFIAFLEDMGPRPSKMHSVDRIDFNSDYCKENCRWATAKEQARNTRVNRMEEYEGEVKCISEWVEIHGIKASSVYNKLSKGIGFKDILDGLIYKSKK